MRQRFCLVGVACVALPMAHAAVPVAEATPVPGTNATYRPPCSSLDLSDFSASIYDEANECTIIASYKWTSSVLPTPAQRDELCDCTSLIRKIKTVKVPRCSLVRNGTEFSYATVITYAFGICQSNGGTFPPTLPPASTRSPPTISPTLAPSPPLPITVTPTIAPSLPRTTSPTPTTTSPIPTRDTLETDTRTSKKSDSESNVGLIIAIVVGAMVVVAAAVFTAFKCGQRHRAVAKQDPDHADYQDTIGGMPLSPAEAYRSVPSSLSTAAYYVGTAKVVAKANSTPHTTGSSGGYSGNIPSRTARPTEVAMWEDPALLAVRVPYDTVFFGPLLSRGGYGEVYKGIYRGEPVAIKQLLPERRKDLAQIDIFLSEIKLMSTLEHERIIRFIGVAWNALSDACVIVEYMENGDLRSVLTKWSDQERRPQGFDSTKVKIALHVAHALTYLHSLEPVVVHRDLKSKNILLDASYDAKLIDFGVSRERADSTMTAAVGTSLWMAPEVMLGERYDEKADIFSFGIVLSELDSQQLPYAHAKDTTDSGRKLPDSAILQMVSLGRLQICFSANAHPDLVQLGRDCVRLDAKKRPTSAQVLHRVHQVLRSSF